MAPKGLQKADAGLLPLVASMQRSMFSEPFLQFGDHQGCVARAWVVTLEECGEGQHQCCLDCAVVARVLRDLFTEPEPYSSLFSCYLLI